MSGDHLVAWRVSLAIALTATLAFSQGCPSAEDDDSPPSDDDAGDDDGGDDDGGDDDGGDDDGGDDDGGDDDTATPGVVYVTIAGHLEDVAAYANCQAYPDYRGKLIAFADLIEPYGVAFNLQIEYEFLLGASNCDNTPMQQNTDGRNVVDYLAVQYGFEIDAHQEGGWEEGNDNYAD